MTGGDFISFEAIGREGAGWNRIRIRMHGLNPHVAAPVMVSMFDGAQVENLSLVLSRPGRVWVDTSCGDAAAFSLVGTDDLTLRLSTRSAICHEVSSVVVQAVIARLPQLIAQEQNMVCALQEAIGNAVMHGNLGLDSSLRATIEGLTQYSAHMAQRQSDPVLAALPITIRVKIRQDGIDLSVEDQGAGFDPALKRSQTAHSFVAGGLGIGIIEQSCARMSFSQGGRCVSMAFNKASA